jgi:YrbI family 3-deoxy-D-manno-octulosonate 8-phosphate phosphatase
MLEVLDVIHDQRVQRHRRMKRERLLPTLLGDRVDDAREMRVVLAPQRDERRPRRAVVLLRRNPLLLRVARRRHVVINRRAHELGITELHQGTASKLDEVTRVAERLGITFDQIVYVGDDLPDLAAMARVAISAAPSDAAPEVRAAATWKLEAAGGRGAFREVVERLLRERGVWNAIVNELTNGQREAQSI